MPGNGFKAMVTTKCTVVVTRSCVCTLCVLRARLKSSETRIEWLYQISEWSLIGVSDRSAPSRVAKVRLSAYQPVSRYNLEICLEFTGSLPDIGRSGWIVTCRTPGALDSAVASFKGGCGILPRSGCTTMICSWRMALTC